MISPINETTASGQVPDPGTHKRSRSASSLSSTVFFSAMSTTSGQGSSSSEDLVDFEDIKQWIAEQEAHQARTSQPAQLTPALRQAITILKSAARTAQKQVAMAPPAEPEMGDRNWIGLLQRYRDAHKDTAGLLYDENPWDGPSVSVRWVTTVNISEAPGVQFPSPGLGAPADGAVPSFARKKDSKQYAAKTAVKWLMSQQFMPTDGESVTFKKAKTPLAPPAPTAPPSATASSASQPPNPPAQKKQAAPAPAPLGLSTPEVTTRKEIAAVLDPDGEEDAGARSSTQLVAEMCRRLNYAAPKYELKAVENTKDMFSGYADFDLETRIPHSVGVVENIFTKKHAKEKIADQILEYLLKVEKDRKILRDKILNNLRTPPAVAQNVDATST